ncbi:hypothetical protein B0O99DRAFT_41675 [Bisporella sp. PMI_857]|nr:hypothetical protein B0O99DRAFT_41675 [Bisporella sp. PMI_857]
MGILSLLISENSSSIYQRVSLSQGSNTNFNMANRIYDQYKITAAGRSTQMIIEASSYTTTPSNSPPLNPQSNNAEKQVEFSVNAKESESYKVHLDTNEFLKVKQPEKLARRLEQRPSTPHEPHYAIIQIKIRNSSSILSAWNKLLIIDKRHALTHVSNKRDGRSKRMDGVYAHSFNLFSG